MVCYSVKLGADGLLIPGIILALLPLIVIPILAVLPARLLGVDEVPPKERAVQLLIDVVRGNAFRGVLDGIYYGNDGFGGRFG